MFLMTDAQVADERFLVLINDLLASGEIPDLFADDEIENIINGVRGEVSGEGNFVVIFTNGIIYAAKTSKSSFYMILARP